MDLYDPYVILDVFSRYVVGWRVAQAESAAPAKGLISETYRKQAIEPGQLTMHADPGSSTSKPVSLLLADLRVTETHTCPHVSNDNPFSESQLRTLKYRPDLPKRLGSIEHARTFCRPFFDWYNQHHHHGGIALLTPEVVHYGLEHKVIEARAKLLLDAYRQHPERLVNGPPRPPSQPQTVRINPTPARARAQEVLQ